MIGASDEIGDHFFTYLARQRYTGKQMPDTTIIERSNSITTSNKEMLDKRSQSYQSVDVCMYGGEEEVQRREEIIIAIRSVQVKSNTDDAGVDIFPDWD